MGNKEQIYLGIDIGAVSLNVAALTGKGRIIHSTYERTKGKPITTLIRALKTIHDERSIKTVNYIVVTGSGREIISKVLEIPAENEILAHAYGTFHSHPHIRTVFEIGGQDSKLILFGPSNRDGCPVITDHAMNEICAAGTGSFLDQQAGRLHIPIEEFGDIALRSPHPATVAGRCAVFAKSDLIHLQQRGAPLEDITAGLCYAMARNYISNLCRGRELEKPIAFQGGVAANKGVVKAFRDLLKLGDNELIIPEYYPVMGAIGAALLAQNRGNDTELTLASMIDKLERCADSPHHEKDHLPILSPPAKIQSLLYTRLDNSKKIPAYIGVDVGAVSTNISAINENREILTGVYLKTAGNPIEAVKKGLKEIGTEIGDYIDVKGVCTTGSGRYLVSDFIGADMSKNEITAQAKGILAFHPGVDTIFEIGGQDSKYIRLKNGVILDFEMNKVCAAGTGSFLDEQAERLTIKIDGEYSDRAFNAKFPANLGSRCTVFMESDIIHHQQQGCSKDDILAGLSYSIARNFLEKVVCDKEIGDSIFFSGGVASNDSVIAAFKNILKKKINVAPYHKYTGAVGAAIIALENYTGRKSNFRGFDFIDRKFTVTSFECKGCPNLCEVNKIKIENLPPSFYGSICGKYEDKKGHQSKRHVPDLFDEREKALLKYWCENNPKTGRKIGIPRTLLFFTLFPQWAAFFNELGFQLVLSDRSNKRLYHQGIEKILTETCYPVKAAFGHVLNLVEKGVDTIFLPCYVDMERVTKDIEKNYNCPYISAIPVFINSSMDVNLISPALDFENIGSTFEEQLLSCGISLGKSKPEVERAVEAAKTAQKDFEDWCKKRGKEVIDHLQEDEIAVILMGKPYNTCDRMLSSHIPEKIRDMGITTIPIDFLPLEDVHLSEGWDRVIWQAGQSFLRAAEILKQDKRLFPILVTNFACGPDSYTCQHFKEVMSDKPSLILELDEHFADAGLLTRIEAFIDSLGGYKKQLAQKNQAPVFAERRYYPFTPAQNIYMSDRIFYIPYMSDHSYAFEVAFKSIGLKAKVLPPPDEESDMLGRKYTTGVNCHPLVLMTGDMLKMPRDDEFKPEKAAFFFPGNDEPCRLSQFAISWRRTLEKVGLGDVKVVSPISAIAKDQLSDVFGLKHTTIWWRACVAIDLLLKRRMEIRPYELNEGETDRVYDKVLNDVKQGFLERKHLQALSKAADELNAVPTRKKKERPKIGIMGGDYYLRINSYANNEICREIERLGGCVCLPTTLIDYVSLQAIRIPEILRCKKELHKDPLASIRKEMQAREAKRIETAFKNSLEYHSEPSVEELMDYALPYSNEKMEPSMLFNVGKVVDYARKGVSGIANIIPLSCLVGTIVTSTLKRIHRDYNGIPIMTLIFDGLKQTNQKTRIEAFMNQAKLYHQGKQ